MSCGVSITKIGSKMDKAKLVEYNLDIILGCPQCDYVFVLSIILFLLKDQHIMYVRNVKFL